MFETKWLRQTVGTVLGGSAGLSLTATILPTVVAAMGVGDSFLIRWALSDYAAHTTLLWAMGGWAVATRGTPKFGSLILGIVGGISGMLLSMVALNPAIELLLGCGITGMLYGGLGGMLLGNVLQPPPSPSRNE